MLFYGWFLLPSKLSYEVETLQIKQGNAEESKMQKLSFFEPIGRKLKVVLHNLSKNQPPKSIGRGIINSSLLFDLVNRLFLSHLPY